MFNLLLYSNRRLKVDLSLSTALHAAVALIGPVLLFWNILYCTEKPGKRYVLGTFFIIFTILGVNEVIKLVLFSQQCRQGRYLPLRRKWFSENYCIYFHDQWISRNYSNHLHDLKTHRTAIITSMTLTNFSHKASNRLYNLNEAFQGQSSPRTSLKSLVLEEFCRFIFHGATHIIWCFNKWRIWK